MVQGHQKFVLQPRSMEKKLKGVVEKNVNMNKNIWF